MKGLSACFVAWLIAMYSAAATALDRSHLALVVNTSDPLSVQIANYYAAQRRIFFQNVIKVAFSPTGPPPTEPTFTGITKLPGNKLQLEWVGAGTLEQADSVAGPWTAVPAASAVGIITPSGAGKFYRLHQP